MTAEYEYRLLTRAIETYGINTQYMKTIEELGELIRALARFSVSKDDFALDDFDNLIEEIADVEIMIEQIKITLMDSNVITIIQKQKAKKLERLKKRLDTIDSIRIGLTNQ